MDVRSSRRMNVLIKYPSDVRMGRNSDARTSSVQCGRLRDIRWGRNAVRSMFLQIQLNRNRRYIKLTPARPNAYGERPTLFACYVTDYFMWRIHFA